MAVKHNRPASRQIALRPCLAWVIVLRKMIRREGGISVPNDNHETLKVREVAAILRCGRNQAYELIQRGEIRAVRIGRAIRVTREALEEFKAGREAAAQAR
jgi:excisionase family DNA binding protein